MDEYIKKEDIEQKIQDGLNKLVLGHDAVEVLGMIYEMPAADVAPVRHGRWDSNDLNGYKWAFACSECGWVDGYPFNDRHNYCPECGALMDRG